MKMLSYSFSVALRTSSVRRSVGVFLRYCLCAAGLNLQVFPVRYCLHLLHLHFLHQCSCSSLLSFWTAVQFERVARCCIVNMKNNISSINNININKYICIYAKGRATTRTRPDFTAKEGSDICQFARTLVFLWWICKTSRQAIIVSRLKWNMLHVLKVRIKVFRARTCV